MRMYLKAFLFAFLVPFGVPATSQAPSPNSYENKVFEFQQWINQVESIFIMEDKRVKDTFAQRPDISNKQAVIEWYRRMSAPNSETVSIFQGHRAVRLVYGQASNPHEWVAKMFANTTVLDAFESMKNASLDEIVSETIKRPLSLIHQPDEAFTRKLIAKKDGLGWYFSVHDQDLPIAIPRPATKPIACPNPLRPLRRVPVDINQFLNWPIHTSLNTYIEPVQINSNKTQFKLHIHIPLDNSVLSEIHKANIKHRIPDSNCRNRFFDNNDYALSLSENGDLIGSSSIRYEKWVCANLYVDTLKTRGFKHVYHPKMKISAALDENTKALKIQIAEVNEINKVLYNDVVKSSQLANIQSLLDEYKDEFKIQFVGFRNHAFNESPNGRTFLAVEAISPLKRKPGDCVFYRGLITQAGFHDIFSRPEYHNNPGGLLGRRQ